MNRVRSDLAVTYDRRDVKLPLADQIIALEQVTIPGLHRKHVGLHSGRRHVEQETVVEARVAGGAAVVSVSLLLVILTNESFDEDI